MWKSKKEFDLSFATRVVRLLKVFAIMRNIYRGPPDSSELLSILPASPRCTVGIRSLCSRVRYLFQLSIKEKAESVLGQAHLPVFMKKVEFQGKLMMSGIMPPPPLPGQTSP